MGAGLTVVLLAGLVSAAVLPGPVGRSSAGGATPVEPVEPVEPVDDAPGPAVDPDLALVSVSVRRAEFDDGLAERVAFCFSRAIREAGPADRLVLLGPDVDTEVAAVDVDLLVSDPNCLLAGFPAGTPVSRYTVAVAEQGAAIDLDAASVASTVPVPGTPPVTVELGGTSAPDLVDVRLDRTLDRIAFVYDEPLDETVAAVAPAAFRYSTRSGRTRTGDALIAIDRNEVVVAFPTPGDVGDAVRVGALAGAVRDRAGQPSPPGEKALEPDGTTTPELRAVDPVPRSEVLFDFRFDEAVDGAVPLRFALYLSDGSPLLGTAVTRPDPSTVRVLVPQARAARPVLAAAEPAAVRDVGSGAAPNPLGIVRLAPSGAVPGRTTGPDLVAARLDETGSTLRLVFDEPLEDDARVDPRAVTLVLPNGRRVPADAFAQVRGTELILLVDPAAAGAARRVVLDRGAVRAEDGERSAPGSRTLER